MENLLVSSVLCNIGAPETHIFIAATPVYFNCRINHRSLAAKEGTNEEGSSRARGGTSKKERSARKGTGRGEGCQKAPKEEEDGKQ
jgi:hypothetical protein